MACCDKIIESSRQLTACECEMAGYCKRHRLHKNEIWHNLCRTDYQYFDQYEKGIGPGQVFTDSGSLESPHPTVAVIGGKRVIYLGDFLAHWFAKFGIKGWAGCGCDSRRARLNRFRIWPWW